MTRIVTLACALSIVFAAAAAAQSPLRMAVTECGGAQEATWACDTNTGEAVTLVASVVIPEGIVLTELTGQRSRVRFDFIQPVSSWWQAGVGLCRPLNVMQVDVTSGTATCGAKMTDGGSLIGANAYRTGPDDSDPTFVLSDRQARLDVESAFLPQDPPAPWAPGPGTEVALFTLRIGRQNTTGAGACDGCTDCVLISLYRLSLMQPAGSGDHFLASLGEPESFVAGQGHWYECVVPARRSTWGQVKSLYR